MDNHLKILQSKSGLTLTELIVASVLVGIIMVGIVSFNFAMKRLEDTSSSTAILASKAAAFMSIIKKDAQKAVGNLTDNGVMTDGNTTICFRHDVASTPSDYTDDQWVCYNHSGAAPRAVSRHENVTAPIPCTSPVNCTAQDSRTMSNLIELETDVFFSVPGGCGACTSGNTMEHIDITFTAIRDGNDPSDPLRNPTITLTTKVNPPAHGRN